MKARLRAIPFYLMLWCYFLMPGFTLLAQNKQSLPPFNIQQQSGLFRKNIGQWEPSVLYRGTSPSWESTVQFLKQGLSFSFSREQEEGKNEMLVWNLYFEGGNSNNPLIAVGQENSHTNYITGNTFAKYYTNVPDYHELTYENIFNQVDIRYYSSGEKLKYDVIVKAGGDINSVQLRTEGIQQLTINEQGQLEITTPWGILIEELPEAYQIIHGKKVLVEIHYSKINETTFGFSAPHGYNIHEPLVIDPINIEWGTHVGSKTQVDEGYFYDFTVDNAGYVYGTGHYGNSFPTTAGVYSASNSGTNDAFIFKLSPDATTLIYCTYVGGSSGDAGHRIKVNNAGEAFVTGSTGSGNFPTTPGAYKTTYTNPSTTSSGTFALRLNAAGTNLIYSSFLGGAYAGIGGSLNLYMGCAIDINASDEAYVVSTTASNSGFTAAGGYSTTFNGGTLDGYLIKLNAAGTSAIFATYLGGSADDHPIDVKVDNGGNIFVTGFTYSTNFPTTTGAYKTTNAGQTDIFVSKFNPAGSSLDFSTFIGTTARDRAYSVRVNNAGSVFVSGCTQSTTFPTTLCAFQTTYGGDASPGPVNGGGGDMFITKFNSTGTQLMFSSYFGGNSSDYRNCRLFLRNGVCEDDTLWGSITTHSGDLFYMFPTTTFMKYKGNGGLDQPVVFKMSPPPVQADFVFVGNQCKVPVQFTDSSKGPCSTWYDNWKPSTWHWDFGDGTTSTLQNPQHTYNNAGSYTVKLIISCPNDTVVKTVPIICSACPLASTETHTDAACGNNSGTAQVHSTGAQGPLSFSWQGAVAGSSDSTAVNLAAGNYSVIITDSVGCKDTVNFVVGNTTSPVINDSITNPTCQGGNNGKIDITVLGGTTPYIYSWSGPGGFSQTTEDISNLSAQTYTVLVTDANGCSGTKSFTLTTPLPPALVVTTSASSSNCSGDSVKLSSTVSGGSPAYIYTWNPGGTTTSSINVKPSVPTTYTLDVTDACGVVSSSTIIVTPGTSPTLSFTGDSVSCAPLCTKLTSTFSGTSADCLWNFGDGTTSTVCNPSHCYTAAGIYSVDLTISDNNGCKTKASKNNWINVSAQPDAQFDATPNPTTLWDPMIHFTDASTGGPYPGNGISVIH